MQESGRPSGVLNVKWLVEQFDPGDESPYDCATVSRYGGGKMMMCVVSAEEDVCRGPQCTDDARHHVSVYVLCVHTLTRNQIDGC